MTHQLFQKYIDRNCTPEEKKEAEQWLHSCSSGELDMLLLEIWNDKNNPLMPAEQTQELWEKFSFIGPGRKQEPKRVHRLFTRGMAAAAAVAAILVISLFWMPGKTKPGDTITATLRQQPAGSIRNQQWLYTGNTGTKEKMMVLEDGTKLSLYPGSVLQYPVQFAKSRRDIFLEGKAIFNVAKDKQRPFTVYSHDVATTALGTKFLVDETNASHTTVALYEGKIAVNPNKQSAGKWQEKILLPGDVFTYDAGKKIVAVKRNEQVPYDGTNGNAGTIRSHELNFTNAELAEVFEVLKDKYRSEIKYNQADIRGMYFTGIISKTSSLVKVLKAIAQMNGLVISEQNGKYIVQKN